MIAQILSIASTAIKVIDTIIANKEKVEQVVEIVIGTLTNHRAAKEALRIKQRNDVIKVGAAVTIGALIASAAIAEEYKIEAEKNKTSGFNWTTLTNAIANVINNAKPMLVSLFVNNLQNDVRKFIDVA